MVQLTANAPQLLDYFLLIFSHLAPSSQELNQSQVNSQ